jgi:hypothetical protein
LNEIKLSSWELSPSGTLSTEKKKLLWMMALLCSVVMIPLTIKNFLMGYYLLASNSAAFTLCLLISVHPETPVIPAKAGIHSSEPPKTLDPRLREDDEKDKPPYFWMSTN